MQGVREVVFVFAAAAVAMYGLKWARTAIPDYFKNREIRKNAALRRAELRHQA